MQKLLIVVVLLCVHQMSFSQLHLGIWGGPQVTSVKETNQIPGWESDIKPRYSNRSGINLGLLIQMPISSRLYFQPSLMYSSKGRKYYHSTDSTASVITDTISAASNMGINYIEFPLNVTYKIPLSSKAKFLLSAGPYVGFFYSGKQKFETRIYSTNNFKSEEAKLETGKSEGKINTFDAGFNVRAGFEIGNVLITGFMSQGLTSFYTASYDGSFRHQVKGLSVGFWLNKVQEPIKPVKVQIPVKPAVPKVIPDTDGDGLNDEKDACPDKPGTIEYNGCPVPDSDGDGLNDKADACPDKPGPVEFNGCPIPDSDGDGLNDKEDKCPSDPGTIENNGCPAPAVLADTVRKEVVKKLNFAAQNILFNANSDQLTDASATPLNEVFQVLENHPSIKLRIEGHTDASGNPEINKELSEKRALSVKKYLTEKGIEDNRLMSIGFGSEKPVATNKTPAGRAKNRRVELKLIQ
jgi:OOP family OmpA-OmpF porin